MLAVLLDHPIIIMKIELQLLPHLKALSVNKPYLDFKVYLTYAPVMTIGQENNVIEHKVQHFVQITIFSPTHPVDVDSTKSTN